MQLDKTHDQPTNDGRDASEICWLLRYGQRRTPRQHHFVCDYSLPQARNSGEAGVPKLGRQFGADEPPVKQMRQGGDTEKSTTSLFPQFF